MTDFYFIESDQNVASEEKQEEEEQQEFLSHALSNYANMQYYGSLYFGSNEAEHEFIFDTGSAWLWVPSTACQSSKVLQQCHTTNLYDAESSETFQKLRYERKKLVYEKGFAEGYISTDKVCLSVPDTVSMDSFLIAADESDASACLSDMLFIEVDSTGEL